MQRTNYVEIIKGLENDDTKRIIGTIDINTIMRCDVESLYYIYPLIERIVLEIYKLLPLTDVECYEQGTMRTILSIIEKNPENYLSRDLINVLKKHYKDTGLRNKMLHVTDDVGIVEINISELDIYELQDAIVKLLLILHKLCESYNDTNFGNIDLIEAEDPN